MGDFAVKDSFEDAGAAQITGQGADCSGKRVGRKILSIFGEGRKWGGGSSAGRDGGVMDAGSRTPPSVAIATATSPFVAEAKNGEDQS